MSCPICLEDLKGMLIITTCGHKFHPSCIANWRDNTPRKRRNKCPHCNQVFDRDGYHGSYTITYGDGTREVKKSLGFIVKVERALEHALLKVGSYIKMMLPHLIATLVLSGIVLVSISVYNKIQLIDQINKDPELAKALIRENPRSLIWGLDNSTYVKFLIEDLLSGHPEAVLAIFNMEPEVVITWLSKRPWELVEIMKAQPQVLIQLLKEDPITYEKLWSQATSYVATERVLSTFKTLLLQ